MVRQTTLVFVTYDPFDKEWEVAESPGYFRHKTIGTFNKKKDAVETGRSHAKKISKNDFFDEVFFRVENKDGETVKQTSYTGS